MWLDSGSKNCRNDESHRFCDTVVQGVVNIVYSGASRLTLAHKRRGDAGGLAGFLRDCSPKDSYLISLR